MKKAERLKALEIAPIRTIPPPLAGGGKGEGDIADLPFYSGESYVEETIIGPRWG